ncbi:MAG: discoidin domain-containing protein, partial [Chitinophagaceae bacterium]
GEDLDATTDLGSVQKIKGVSLRAFEQTASWIYRPAFVSFYASVNGKDFTLMGTVLNATAERHLVFSLDKKIAARYIRVVAKNAGTIAPGNPGEGNMAWLFADEIIIN